MEIRSVRPDEHDALGELTVAVYGALPGSVMTDGYEDELRDVAGRLASAEVLVAVEDGEVVGGVTYVPGIGPLAEFADPDAAGIRMLVVSPDHQGRGVGRTLVEGCLERAVAARRHRMILHTTEWMPAAHRLYERLGFVRTPELDEHFPEIDLLAYVLELPGATPG